MKGDIKMSRLDSTTEYKSNSYRSKEEQKKEERQKLDKIVTGTVKTKKKSEVHKLADIFISEDVKNVKSYVLMDVLVPAIKKAISDIVTNGIDMILYGESGRRNRNTGSSGFVSYSSYSRNNDRRSTEPVRRNTYDFGSVILETRGEAEDVLDRMTEIIETYEFVSVADLFDLIGQDCNYTDQKYGWTNLRDASVERTRDGYLLKLPKVTPLNK